MTGKQIFFFSNSSLSLAAVQISYKNEMEIQRKLQQSSTHKWAIELQSARRKGSLKHSNKHSHIFKHVYMKHFTEVCFI